MIRTRPVCPHCHKTMQSYREHVISGRTVLQVPYIEDGDDSWREGLCKLIDGNAGPEKPQIEYQCGECGEWLDAEPEMQQE